MKTKICSVGECMIEIANTKNNIFQQSFAGDTLNFCNYIDKKYFDVSFLTAIGKTSVNRSVLEFINSKKISTKLIKQVNSHEIGLYLIKNRNNGEKQFFYWRDNSAAKNYFNKIDFVSLFKNLKNFDYIYLSGITLSIIDPSKISNFVDLLNLLKNKKVKIIFDFNIRINRWTKKNLNNFLHSILNFVDICFVSGEDLKFWKNDNSLSNFEKLINKYKIDHGIFRKNAELTYAIQNKKKYTIRNKFIRKVIDTSGAGDGFNAAYVSNFIIHNDPALALKEASLLGSKIIMQKGAIVDVK